MPIRSQATRRNTRHYVGLRCASAWLLCSLVLLFCASARQSRYYNQNESLKLTTSQSFSESDATGIGVSLIALLLLWSTARVAGALFAGQPTPAHARAMVSVVFSNSCDDGTHLRAPPRQ